jgi:hypothetical protein
VRGAHVVRGGVCVLQLGAVPNRELPAGMIEFRASYAYAVRWGVLGRAVDRWLLRPLMQRETGRSFDRLARRWFSGASA